MQQKMREDYDRHDREIFERKQQSKKMMVELRNKRPY